MKLKKNDRLVVPKCPCEACCGPDGIPGNCVLEAVGKVHIVCALKLRGDNVRMKCGLLTGRKEVVKAGKQDTQACAECARGEVVWHQPGSPEDRHNDILEGLGSLHHLMLSMLNFMTLHFHANAGTDGDCPACMEMKKNFDEHKKGCQDCHE